ncbi:MAG TPA: hypothetical protein VIS96_16495 [Terrimicrobiaceae bacterium]
MRHWRYLVLIVLLATPGIQAAPKDSPVVPPPMARPQNVAIFRGRSVEIPLRAQGRTPGQLKFLLRSRPSQGRLGEVRLTGPRSAAVTYTHDGTGQGSDSFTFAVQAVDSPVSAAAPITITISEEPPALSVVHSIDFGTVQVGETREEQITLRNSGGGVLAGRMEAPPPWKILGAPEYRLGRNQERKVRILFAPGEEQQHFGRLAFSHDARSAVEFSARAMSPFEFDPSREIELTSKDGGAQRSADVVLQNRTSRDRIVEISVPPEIASPAQALVPAGEEAKIVLHTQPDFLGALEGAANFESEGFRHSIRLRVFALQPVLRIEPREGLDFGDIEPNKRYRGVLRIKNAGGSAARLRAATSGEILLVPDPNTAILPPGETRLFEVALEASSPGDYRSQITIDAAGGKSVSIDVSGRITARPPDARKIPTAILDPSSREPSVAESAQDQPSSAIPPVAEIKVLKASNRIFEIGWKIPSTEHLTWMIQQHRFEMADGGSPKFVWRDLRNIKFFEENGITVARFENLAPGQVWLLRIVAIDEQGRRSAPSPTIKLASAAPRRYSVHWWIAGVLAAGAVALGFTKLRERKQAEAFREADRIARIEGGL